MIGEGERLVFERWISYQDNGYSGYEVESNLTMVDDIRETAEWKKQYYLNIPRNHRLNQKKINGMFHIFKSSINI